MSGNWGQAWGYLGLEVWEPLAEYTSGEGAVAPADIFSDLYALATEYFAQARDGAQAIEREARLVEARSDAAAARGHFIAIRAADFASESAMVGFLEEAREVVAGYEVPGLEERYEELLKAVVQKLNLRYRVVQPFQLRFMLPGSFTNLYDELTRVNVENAHLGELLNDFEKSFDRYARSGDATDLKTCIAKASNYAEGLASATYGSAGTLGALCDRLTDWPHDRVKEALKSLYKYCSDYPGIRHAGDPAGVRRDLATRDMTLACLLFLSFAGYLSPKLDEKSILGV